MRDCTVLQSKLGVYPALAKKLGTLTKTHLFWQEQNIQQQLELNDVVGTSLVDRGAPRQPCLLISAYPKQASLWGKKQRRVLREYYFTCADLESRIRWQKAIDNVLIGRPVDSEVRHRHLQVLINPSSGRKKAAKIFDRVRPMLDRANLSYEVTQTSSARDTVNSVRNLNLQEVDGLVIIGGDGTIHDAIAGLMSSYDRAASKLPLGVIPGGTGNGLCKSLLESAGESYSPINAAFIIAKGRLKSFDLVSAVQNKRQYYSFLSLAWGLVSDIDLESEKIRFLGALRFDLYALFLMCVKHTYRGRFSFQAHPSCKSFQAIHHRDWQVIEDDFLFIWAMNTPWAAHDMNVAPRAKLNDGAIDVLVMRQSTPRLEILRALLLCGRGKHLDLPHLEYYKVSAFKLEPLTKSGLLLVDGELVDYSPIEMKVISNLAWVNC